MHQTFMPCGSTTYYVAERLRRRHALALSVAWLVLLGLFSVLLARSNETQYDCFSFCDTTVRRSCAMLHTTNKSDTSWQERGSSCFDPATSLWTSSGSGTADTAGDVIPDMTSSARRFNRLILRFSTSDYGPAASLQPTVRYVQLNDGRGHALPTPVVLASASPSNVWEDTLSNGNAAILFDLPLGAPYPANAQQLQLAFADGAPLVRKAAAGNGSAPVQLTLASSKPAYVVADAVVRYCVLACGLCVAALVVVSHAVSDAAYDAFDASLTVLSWRPATWLAVPLFAWRTEGAGFLRRAFGRFSVSTRLVVVLVLLAAAGADPLAGVFVAVPGSGFLQAWTLHIMPWFRFCWMVGVATVFMAFTITSGGRGRLLMAALSETLPGHDAVHPSAPWKIFATLGATPVLLYLASVVSGMRSGQPSYPEAIGDTNGIGMIPALVGLQLILPMLLFVFWRYRNRVLYGRIALGVDDAASPIYGTPSDRLLSAARPAQVWLRYQFPFVAWSWVFYAGVFFGILTGLGSLLPSYLGGQMVEVLMCNLMAWTAALTSIPLRSSLGTHPPRPSQYPLRLKQTTGDSCGNGGGHSAVPLLSVPLADGRSDASADLGRPLWQQLPWTTAYFNGIEERSVPNLGYAFGTESDRLAFEQQLAQLDASVLDPGVARSFFCWETAVRCLNMSNEAYYEVEGERDLKHLSETAEYDESFCESCIVNRCCCCFFGGCTCCGNSDVLDDEPPAVPAAAVDTMRPTVGPLPTYDTDHHHATMVRHSARRFSEVGPVATASRQSAMRRRQSVHACDDQTDDEHSAPPVLGTERSSSGRMPAFMAPAVASSPDGDYGPVSPTGSPTTKQASPSGMASPTTAAPPPVQIDVTKYGYELVKVLDVFGVRVLIAATPPGTTNRTRHLCIAFRGTVNLRNALTDANARMVPHPEMDAGCEVHRGFWAAFQHMVPHLRAALQTFISSPETSEWAAELDTIVCTGHSLGGALAMLCSYSLAAGALGREVFPTHVTTPVVDSAAVGSHAGGAEWVVPQVAERSNVPKVLCYTYGSPKVGNSLLSLRYNAKCPETYRVINENDLVSRVGLCWQEHTGREVLINRDGDAIVEGTWLETEYRLTMGVGSSIKNHFLTRYGNGMDNCLCKRNLNLLGPDCCSFMLVHLDPAATASNCSPPSPSP